MKKFLFIFSLGILLFGLTPVFASGLNPSNDDLLKGIAGKSGYNSGTDETTIAEQAGNIIKSVLTLVGTIFLVLAVYGGITWMTAMGNSDKIDKAREIIVAAVIGVSISAGAYGITYFVFSRLGEANSVNNSENVGCCIYALPGESKQSKSTMTKGECDNVNGNWDANSSGCY